MSVDPNDPRPGAQDAAGKLLARAAADARAERRLAMTIDDLLLPEHARLDDRLRAAIGVLCEVLTGSVEADIRHHAARLLGGRGRKELAERLAGSRPALEHLIERGVLRDAELIGELVSRAREAILAESLPASGPEDTERPSLLARLVNGSDGVVSAAASAMMAADSRRRTAMSGDRSARADFPAELHHRVAWWIAAAFREIFEAAGGDDASEVDRALVEAAQRSLAAHDEGDRLEATAMRLAAAIDAQPDELSALLDEALSDRRLTLFTAVLARTLGFDYATMRDIVLDPGAERLWLALRALDLHRDIVARIGLALGSADPRRDAEAIAGLLDPIMAIAPHRARAALATLRLDPDYRAAILALARGGPPVNAVDAGLPPVHGLVDRAGRLVEADARLSDLNARAGGVIGEPIAIPQVATLVRLAQRLGILISRGVFAADGDKDIDLWVRAQPIGQGVRLAITGWQPRPSWSAPAGAPHREADFVRSGADWLWETDAALHLSFISVAPGAHSGGALDRLLGQPLTALFALDDDGEGQMPILDALAMRRTFDHQRATIRSTGRAVRLSATPRIDDAGRFAGFIGAAHLAEATGPVSTAETVQSIDPDAFSARLDRALRAPLGRIIAHADSINAQADGELRPDYVDYAADIATAGRHLLGLVDDLVDLQAIERPDFAVAAEPIDLADIAHRAAGLLAVRASDAQVTIDRPGVGETLPATGEFRRVLQILVNLIGNAVRYSPDGATVWVRAERDGDIAAVIVADQGKGIALADQARIFEKFERVDVSEPGGSGLGLYIARRLAQAMGGDVTVDSAPGQGARFLFTLPYRDE